MLNAARSSLLISALFDYQMNNPAWPDAQPWENYLFALVAVLIVVFAGRRSMLQRDTALTECSCTRRIRCRVTRSTALRAPTWALAAT